MQIIIIIGQKRRKWLRKRALQTDLIRSSLAEKIVPFIETERKQRVKIPQEEQGLQLLLNWETRNPQCPIRN